MTDELIVIGNQAWEKDVAPKSVQYANELDKPLTEDTNTVAEFATINALDKEELAKMLVYALQRIDELEGKLNG